MKIFILLVMFLVGLTLAGCDRQKIIQMLKIPQEQVVQAPKIADFGNLKLDSQKIEVLTSEIARPHGLGYSEDYLYVSSQAERKLYRINTSSKGKEEMVANVNFPHDMIINAGELTTPLFEENKLVHIKAGNVREIASGLNGPNGIIEYEDGWLVSNYHNGSVVKISPGGTVQTFIAGLKGPAGTVIDSKDNLYIANYLDSNKSVIKVDADKKISVAASGLTEAESLLIDSNDNILIGHGKNGKGAISRISKEGKVELVLETEIPTPFVGPVTDGEYLYFVSAAENNNNIYRLKL